MVEPISAISSVVRMDKNIYKAKAAVIVGLFSADSKDKSMGKDHKNVLRIAMN